MHKSSSEKLSKYFLKELFFSLLFFLGHQENFWGRFHFYVLSPTHHTQTFICPALLHTVHVLYVLSYWVLYCHAESVSSLCALVHTLLHIHCARCTQVCVVDPLWPHTVLLPVTRIVNANPYPSTNNACIDTLTLFTNTANTLSCPESRQPPLSKFCRDRSAFESSMHIGTIISYGIESRWYYHQSHACTSQCVWMYNPRAPGYVRNWSWYVWEINVRLEYA